MQRTAWTTLLVYPVVAGPAGRAIATIVDADCAESTASTGNIRHGRGNRGTNDESHHSTAAATATATAEYPIGSTGAAIPAAGSERDSGTSECVDEADLPSSGSTRSAPETIASASGTTASAGGPTR
jgi:hypothetical protein